MKFITLILSIYVMLLTGISCDDTFESVDTEATTIKAHDDTLTDCIIDMCSPFCACTCCVGFDKPRTFIANFIFPETVSRDIPYEESACSYKAPPLFQPPQV